MNIRVRALMFFCCLVLILSLVISYSVYANPEISGKAALLMDYQSGAILFSKNVDEPLPMASVTKMMTLVIVLEQVAANSISLQDLVGTSEYAASMRGSRVWLEEGEQLTLKEMLYAIAVGSANDAAVAVAEFISGSELAFVDLMNQRAKELGMTNTVFANCNGLPTDHKVQQMTARDAAILARHAINVPLLMDLVSTYEYTMRAATTKKPQLWNYNRLLRRYPGVDGIKTGYTDDAGYCLAATAVRDDLRLIAVVLGSANESKREADITSILDYGYRNYHSHPVLAKGEQVGTIQFRRGEPLEIGVKLLEDLKVTVERGEEQSISTEIIYNPDLELPIESGQTIGHLRAWQDQQLLAEIPVTTVADVKRGGVLILIFRVTNSMIDVFITN